MTATEQRTFSAKEVADALRVSVSTVYGLVKRGELVAIRIGDRVLFSSSSLSAKWPEIFGYHNTAA